MNIDILNNKIIDWKPSDIIFIKKTVYYKNNLDVVFYSQKRLEKSIWPNFESLFFEIDITFTGVCDLQINFGSNKTQQISGFDISDVTKNGLENINYEIEDYEDNIINFKCNNIEITSVSNAKKINIQDL